MTQAPKDIKVLVLDDYEDFAAFVPSYERVKARAQVTILKTKLASDAELANALRKVQYFCPSGSAPNWATKSWHSLPRSSLFLKPAAASAISTWPPLPAGESRFA